jgi:hypothetical protein
MLVATDNKIGVARDSGLNDTIVVRVVRNYVRRKFGLATSAI